MKNFLIGLKMTLGFTIITGFFYPLLITGYALIFTNTQADGGLLQSRGQTIGSELLAQKFTKQEYFWSRPSSVEYNPSASGASHQGWTSEVLKLQVAERRKILIDSHPESPEKIPQELVFASGSGLDPHISPEGALYQAARIAKSRQITLSEIHRLIAQMTEPPQFGIFGEPRVHVLKLNLALDQLK